MTEELLSLADAQSIVGAALAHGRAEGLKPLTVAVLDRGGHLIALAREDQSSNLRPQIAIGKAAGALSLGVSSRRIADMAVERPTFVSAVSVIAVNGIIPAAGGLLLYHSSGALVGAVGVTGDTSDNDELCGLRGAAVGGFTTSV